MVQVEARNLEFHVCPLPRWQKPKHFICLLVLSTLEHLRHKLVLRWDTVVAGGSLTAVPQPQPQIFEICVYPKMLTEA